MSLLQGGSANINADLEEPARWSNLRQRGCGSRFVTDMPRSRPVPAGRTPEREACDLAASMDRLYAMSRF
jgi:hypothetical protein